MLTVLNWKSDIKSENVCLSTDALLIVTLCGKEFLVNQMFQYKVVF